MIMNSLAAIKEKETTEIESPNFKDFNYSNTPSVQKLLDTIAVIIADEYIVKAKQDPELFSYGGVK